MSKYQGNNVTVVRAAQAGDSGFDAAKAPQSLIRLEDGTQRVVLTSDVTQ